MEALVRRELARRLALPAAPLLPRSALPAPPAPPGARQADNGTLRNRPRTRYFKDPPVPGALLPRVHQMMKQHIYASKERMQALQPIVDKHKNAYRFRMGFVIPALEDRLLELQKLCSHLHYHSVYWLHKVIYHLRYYTHAVSKYVDIVYMVERIIRSFTMYKKQMAARWPAAVRMPLPT